MKVIIIEDEKPAARRLARLLTKHELTATVLLHSVKASIAWFQNNEHPDLIFLDIQLADGLSFEIFEAVEVTSAVIFTTAYDAYALQAFKLKSIDYLLKPIDKDDLAVAIDKFKAFHPISDTNLVAIHEIQKLLATSNTSTYKERFTVKIGQHIKLISVTDSVCFYSENKATYIYTKTKRHYLIEHPLEELHDILDPKKFYRINRQFFIAMDSIQDIIAYTNSRLKIILHHYTDQELIVSRERVKDFKNWLG